MTRGIKKRDSGVITGLRVYHNFMRPHLGLSENQTHAEAGWNVCARYKQVENPHTGSDKGTSCINFTFLYVLDDHSLGIPANIDAAQSRCTV